MPVVGQSQVIRLEWYDRLTNVLPFSFEGNSSGGTPNEILETYTVPADRLALLGAGSLSVKRLTTPTAIRNLIVSLTLNSVTLSVNQIFACWFSLEAIQLTDNSKTVPYGGGSMLQAGDVLRAIVSNFDTSGNITCSGGFLINEFAV